MAAGTSSRTALVAGFLRAGHHKRDDPKIFDDPFAQLLLSPSALSSSDVMTAAEMLRRVENVSAGNDQVMLQGGIRWVEVRAGVVPRVSRSCKATRRPSSSSRSSTLRPA